MKGSEFLRKLVRLAARERVAVRLIADEGHGSHGRVYFGAKYATLKDRKKEIGPGLLGKMCRDLGRDLNMDKREL